MIDMNAGSGVVEAIREIETGKLWTVLRVVEVQGGMLMPALASTIRQELAHRSGSWDGHVRFELPAYLKASELRAAANECLAVSEYCERETCFLFSALAAVLIAEADRNEKLLPPEPIN